MVQLCQAQLSLGPGLGPCLDLGLGPGLGFVLGLGLIVGIGPGLGPAHQLGPCPGLEGYIEGSRRFPEGSQKGPIMVLERSERY